MIGKTIVNMSTAVKNQKNKDLGRWSLVLNLLVLILALHPGYSFSQVSTGTKAKTEAKTGVEGDDNADDNSSDEVSDEGIDDNGDDSKADEESTSNETNQKKPETTKPAQTQNPAPADPQNVTSEDKNENDVEENHQAEELEAGSPSEPESVPVAELPPAESMPEAPPAESMRTDVPPAEALPVQPQPVAPAPEPYVPPVSIELEPAQPSPETATAEADMVEVIPREKTVEVKPIKSYGHYRDRRTTHGFMFNFNAENLYFQDYTSIVDQKLYEELFGQEDLTLLQVQLDYKVNFFLGSLVAGLGYGQGTLVDDRYVNPATNTNEERSLTIEKKSIRAQWLLDSLMKEPYFVPYAGFSYWQMGLKEENTTLGTSNSRNTGNGTSLTAGLLIQLNWIEPDVAKQGYLGEGLENTYLDVFWTQYQNTDDELDPVFENDFNFGVGLRMEF